IGVELPTDALPVPEPSALKYAYAPAPIPITRIAAITAAVFLPFHRTARNSFSCLKMFSFGMGVGFATRSPPALATRMRPCGSMQSPSVGRNDVRPGPHDEALRRRTEAIPGCCDGADCDGSTGPAQLC